jgi:hypothetical protein
MQVTKDSLKGGTNPGCCCGAEMKRPYSKPIAGRVEATAEPIAPLKNKSAPR